MANPIVGQPNFLDLLRERVASSLQDENVRRLSDLGAGMLSSNSPNFFTMLGAGVRAQETGEASRMEQLRRAVEAERQEQARQDEARYREEQIRLTGEGQAETARNNAARLALQRQQAAIAAQRPPVTIGVRSDGTIVQQYPDGRIVDRTGVVPIPLAAADTRASGAREAQADRAGQAAVRQAIANHLVTNPGQTLSQDQQLEIYRAARDRSLIEFPGVTPAPTDGAPAPASPAAPGTTLPPRPYVPPEQRR